jgi:hypothetical protein
MRDCDKLCRRYYKVFDKCISASERENEECDSLTIRQGGQAVELDLGLCV